MFDLVGRANIPEMNYGLEGSRNRGGIKQIPVSRLASPAVSRLGSSQDQGRRVRDLWSTLIPIPDSKISANLIRPSAGA